jgi:hypothetical protein
MYYRIYGVMHESGFNTELFNANTLQKAEEKIKEIDEKRFPFFAITEHLRSGSPALAIYPGVTEDRLPSIAKSLVEYKPNPIENYEQGSALFKALKEKKDAIQATIAENKKAVVSASVDMRPVRESVQSTGTGTSLQKVQPSFLSSTGAKS